MGFESFIEMPTNWLPGHLGYFIVDKFDIEKMELKFGDTCIKVTPQSVHDVFGILIGGTPVISLPNIDCEDPCMANWMNDYPLFPRQTIRPGELSKKIQISKIGDFYSKLNFLMLFTNTMGSCVSNGTILPQFLYKIREDIAVEKLDWCDFIIDCIKKMIDLWKKDKKTLSWSDHVSHCALLFMLF